MSEQRISEARLSAIIVYTSSDERQGYPVPMSEFRDLLFDLANARKERDTAIAERDKLLAENDGIVKSWGASDESHKARITTLEAERDKIAAERCELDIALIEWHEALQIYREAQAAGLVGGDWPAELPKYGICWERLHLAKKELMRLSHVARARKLLEGE